MALSIVLFGYQIHWPNGSRVDNFKRCHHTVRNLAIITLLMRPWLFICTELKPTYQACFVPSFGESAIMQPSLIIHSDISQKYQNFLKSETAMLSQLVLEQKSYRCQTIGNQTFGLSKLYYIIIIDEQSYTHLANKY